MYYQKQEVLNIHANILDALKHRGFIIVHSMSQQKSLTHYLELKVGYMDQLLKY